MTEALLANCGWYAGVLVVYLLATVALGWYFTRRTRSDQDFYVAGRTLGPAVTGFSYAATQMSAGTVIGSVSVGASIGYNYVPVLSVPPLPPGRPS